MLDLVIGAKGKGKTRKMVEKANHEMKLTNGSILYIDKSNKHMYELSNAIRLININDYTIDNVNTFLGFIQGIISSNHSLTHIFLDNFMWLANIEEAELSNVLTAIDKFSVKYDITFVISTAVEEENVPEEFTKYITCKL